MIFNIKNNQIINNSAFVQSEGRVVSRLGFILTQSDGVTSLDRIGEYEPLEDRARLISSLGLGAGLYEYVAMFDFSSIVGRKYSADQQVHIANFLLDYSINRSTNKLMQGLIDKNETLIIEAFQEMLDAK